MDQFAKVIPLLKELPIFKGLSLERLKSVFNICSPEKIAPGVVLFHQGGPSDKIFVLLKGKVETKVNNSPVADIKPVDCIGEIGAICGLLRSATIIGLEHCHFLVLPVKKLQNLFRMDKNLELQLYKNISDIVGKKLDENNKLQIQISKENQEIKTLMEMGEQFIENDIMGDFKENPSEDLFLIEESNIGDHYIIIIGRDDPYMVKGFSQKHIILSKNRDKIENGEKIKGVFKFSFYRPLAFSGTVESEKGSNQLLVKIKKCEDAYFSLCVVCLDSLRESQGSESLDW